MSKKIFLFICTFFIVSVLSAKSMKKDFTTGDLIELDKEFKSERNIITKIEKISDNKACVECSSLIFPAAGDSVIGAHTVVVSYYFTVGKFYKQGKLIKVGENSLTFEYDAAYKNPIYLFSTPEDKQITFYFYDDENYDWEKLVINTRNKELVLTRNSSYQFIYSICFDGLENGEEYLFSYYLVDKNDDKSEIEYKYATPNGQKNVTKSGFYCDISNITCLERNRTLVFKWTNPKDTNYDKLFAEVNGRTYELGKNATELIVNNLCNSQIYDIKFYFSRGSEISNPIFYKGTPRFTNTISSINVETKNKTIILSWDEDKYEEFEFVEIGIRHGLNSWDYKTFLTTYTIPKGTCLLKIDNLKNGHYYDFTFKLKDNLNNLSNYKSSDNHTPTFPNTLSNIKTQSKDYEVLVTWDNNTSDTYSSVEVTASTGVTINVPFPQNSTTFTNLSPNQSYSFKLKMVDSVGDKTSEETAYGFTSISNDILNPEIQKNGDSITISWDESKLTPYVYEIKIRDGLNTYKVKKGTGQFTIENPTEKTMLLSTITASGDESYAINVTL